jgi:vacuolar-type H+-ATPase subunit I/STV1
LLKSAPMKRFYLAAPTNYEDQIIEGLGGLGSAQLISDYTIKGFKRLENVEKCEKYVKLQQRITSILSSLPPEKAAKKSVLDSLKGGFSNAKPKVASSTPTGASLEEIEPYVQSIESQLDEKMEKLGKLRSEANRLKSLEQNLLVLEKYGLRVDSLGDFQYAFVKAGFMNKALSPKLQRYAEGTSIKYTKWPEKREEDFLVIVGLNQDKLHIEEASTLLNFAELTFPKDINPDPRRALEENRTSVAGIEEKIKDIEKDVRDIGKEFQKNSANFEPVVVQALKMEEARSTFSRTETLSLAHGWIPAEHQESMKKTVETSTDGVAFLKFDDPGPDDEPPSRLRNPGLLRPFELITRLRGTPQYRELDPTPIIAVLFPIMYGMMFGDVGQGIVLLILGVIFSRLQRGFLKIPAGGIKRLGGILAMCGTSAIFFGALYGEFFLSEAFHPLFVSPLSSLSTMIIVALLFGVAQLTIGLVLKIVNLLRSKAKIEAAFGGVRLVYYVTGVTLAVKYVSNMSFTVFTDNILLTILAIACLVLLFLSPAIEGLIKHEFKLVERIMMGASEFIETFLSFLTNSISYVRLAAFAIAHSALGLSAAILTTTIGGVPSYIAMNLLALSIEALGVLIQCMRLTYYEFFTKFYSNNGVTYRPFSLPKPYVRIK